MWLKNRTYAVAGVSKTSLEALADCKCIKKILSYDEEYHIGRVTANRYQALWLIWAVNFMNNVEAAMGAEEHRYSIEISTL